MHKKHKIDKRNVMGRVVTRACDDGSIVTGYVIATSVTEWNDAFVTVEPIDGSEVKIINLVGCKFENRSDNIPASVEEVTALLKVASDHRESVVCNITYAKQISGEDTTAYEKELEKADACCDSLMAKIKNVRLI